MNITCPHCRARSRIADERVPGAGAWARCPKCRNRFFIRPPEPEGPPAGAPPAAEADRNDLRRRILRRVRGSAAAEAYASRTLEAGPEPEVLVFPEATLSPRACLALGLALLALPLILIGVFFKSASSWRPAPPPPTTQVAVIDETKRIAYLKGDLLQLRNRMMRWRRLQYSVEYTGSESRVFKHYAARLLPPSVCGDITRLELRSERPSRGFTATATCLDRRHGLVDMEIGWVGRGAVISFPAYRVTEEVELFPSKEE